MSILAELFEQGALYDVLLDFGETVTDRARSNIRIQQTRYGKKRRANTTGTLAASLYYDIDVTGTTPSIGFNSSADYAKWVEYGRQGKESNYKGIDTRFAAGAAKPPVDAILNWMNLKKIKLRSIGETGRRTKFAKSSINKDEAQRLRVANAMAKSIEKKGIAPLYYWREAYLETLPEYGPQLNEAMGDAVYVYILNQTRKLTNIKPV
jgi:hypothetical protein